MPRAVTVALTLALAAAAQPARADGLYFAEGLGPTIYRGDLAASLEAGVHVRGALGYRFGHLALEAWAQGELPAMNGAHAERDAAVPRPGLPTMLGLDVKVIQPLSTHWSGYARTGLSAMKTEFAGYAGRGVQATAGIQLAGKVRALGFLWAPFFFLGVGPKVHAALWFEATTSYHRLHADARPSLDARLTSWTFGFSLGQDF